MSKLGQHFLINKRKIQKIVEALELRDGDTVIEIGPGHGELTTNFKSYSPIGGLNLKIIAIEKDKELVEFLKKRFVESKNVEIIEGDVLKLLSQLTNDLQQTTNDYKLVGNIPYYITGYLFRILGELKNKPSLIVLLIQKEVAERICAKPPKMNLLAAAIQFWAKPKIIANVSKKNFRPAPKVDSVIIKLDSLDSFAVASDSGENYYKFIKILFKQPRKTILNNLRPMINDPRLLTEKLQKLSINPQARPQNLDIKKIMELSTLF